MSIWGQNAQGLRASPQYQPPAGYQPIAPSFRPPNNAGMYKPPASFIPPNAWGDPQFSNPRGAGWPDNSRGFLPGSQPPINGSQGLQSVFAEYVRRQQQRQQGMSPYSPQGQGQGQGIAAMLQKILQLQSGTPQPFNVTPW
jgi:hypothetical protein